MTLSGIVFATSSLVSAASSIYNRYVQGEEKRKELDRNLNNLEASYTQATTQNKEYYDLQRANATLATEQANKMLNKQTALTELNRDNSVVVAGKTLADQGAINAAQIAQIMVQGSQEEGTAQQQNAMSGFRNTGSATNGTYNVRESFRRALALSQAQADLQRYSNYQTALQNYTSATQQAELYRLQVEQNKVQLNANIDAYDKQEAWQKANLKLNYDQQKEALKADKDYMESWKYWTGFGLGVTSDIFGAASDYYKTNKTYGGE